VHEKAPDVNSQPLLQELWQPCTPHCRDKLSCAPARSEFCFISYRKSPPSQCYDKLGTIYIPENSSPLPIRRIPYWSAVLPTWVRVPVARHTDLELHAMVTFRFNL